MHGISLGGATVCLTSEMTLKNVKCVVSDCAYTLIRAEFAHSSKLTMVSRRKPRWNAFINFLQKNSAIPSTTSRRSKRCNTQISDTVYSRQGRPFYSGRHGARTLRRLLLGQTPVPCGRRGTRRVVCKRPERVRIRRYGLCKHP